MSTQCTPRQLECNRSVTPVRVSGGRDRPTPNRAVLNGLGTDSLVRVTIAYRDDRTVTLEFHALGRREVVGRFAAGRLTADGGAKSIHVLYIASSQDCIKAPYY